MILGYMEGIYPNIWWLNKDEWGLIQWQTKLQTQPES